MDRHVELVELVENLDMSHVFLQCVDILNRDTLVPNLVTGIITPFLPESWDTFRAYCKIFDYQYAILLLNRERMEIGKSIARSSNTKSSVADGQWAGRQEVLIGLLATSSYLLRRHLDIIVGNLGLSLSSAESQTIEVFDPLRHDFDHPWDKRGVAQTKGKKFFKTRTDSSGGIVSFNWDYIEGDRIRTSRGVVELSNASIDRFFDSIQTILNTLAARAKELIYGMIDSDDSFKVCRDLLQRTIVVDTDASARSKWEGTDHQA